MKKKARQMKKQYTKQKKRQQKLNKKHHDDVFLNHNGELNTCSGGSGGKQKLPRLVKLNPGINAMSLSFKPKMSLSLSNDDIINLYNSDNDDDSHGESESSSVSSNTSSKKSSSTSTTTN